MDVIEVRTATALDYAAIHGIQQASPEAAQWSAKDYGDYSILVAEEMAEDKSALAGFCIWRQSTPDEAELLNLAVLPGSRRRGIATALLDVLKRAATGEIFLEVAESNGPAISLYEHHGWVRNGLRKNYYGAENVNAIVMRRRA